MRRDLALIVSGVGVSAFGMSLSRIVLMVEIKDHGALAMAAMIIVWLLPASVGAPVFGLLVDRLSNRRLMQAAQFLQAAATFGMAFVLDDLVAVMVGILLVGCGSAVADPAAASLVPRAVASAESAKAFSWLVTFRSSGFVLGTALGGVLVMSIGAQRTMLLDGCTYFVQVLLLLFLKVDRNGGGRRERDGAMAGIRHIAGDRLLAVNIGGLAVVALSVTLINVADVFLILDVLGGGPVLIGWVYAVWMVGQVIGARVAGRLTSQRAMVRTLGWAGAALGLAIFLPAAFTFTAVILVAFLFGGFANGMQAVTRQALLRARTPENLHGRGFAALDSVMRSASVLGTVVGGVAVAGVGPQWSMGSAGVVAILAGVVTLLVGREREPARAVETTRAG